MGLAQRIIARYLIANDRVLTITVAEVMRRLKAERWRLDPHDQSYEQRVVTFYAVNFVHQRHTGSKKELFRVVWYTGNPAHRWSSQTVDTLQEAVKLANKVKPEADRISAEELGESPIGKLASRVAYRYMESNQVIDPKSVRITNMEAYPVDEWATLTVTLEGSWKAPHGDAEKRQLAEDLAVIALKSPDWNSFYGRLPKSLRVTSDEGYEKIGIPHPRSPHDFEDWEIGEGKATLTASERD